MTNEKLIAYLSANSAYQPSVIPHNKAFTFLTKQTGDAQAWIWREDGINQLTFLDDRVMKVYVSPDGEKMIVGSDYKGNEMEQFYLMDIDGSNVQSLVVSPDHLHHFGGWSPDGSKIAYSSNRRRTEFLDTYILDIETKEEKVVFEFNGTCHPVCWTRDGKGLVVSTQLTSNDQTPYIVDIETGEKARIGLDGAEARYKSIKLSKNGEVGYLVSDEGADTMDIFEFNFRNPGQLKKIVENGKWDIEEIAISPDEKGLLYTVNEGGISRIYYYQFETKESIRLSGIPNGVVEAIQWLSNQEFIYCLKSPTQPGDIWLARIQEPSDALPAPELLVERLTTFGVNETYQKEMMEPELHSFTSFDGVEVPYFFYGSKDVARPTIIFVHGGPASQTRATYNPVFQFLASDGFNIVAPNVRGSTGYGRKYEELDNKRKRMDSVADLAALAKELEKQGIAKSNSIGIMGRSYGGFMVLAALTHYPDIWAAGIDIVGISNFRTFLENTSPWRRSLREHEYGTLEEDADFLEEIAPINHSKNITAPLLIFHGRNDTRVPVSEAEQIYKDLKEQKKIVEMVIFEDEGHQTEKMENLIKMNADSIQFFKKYLQ